MRRGSDLISVFLVDDHELVRTGIRRILEDVRGIRVVGEAENGENAVQWCRDNNSDVILMDMNMPGIGGLRLQKRYYGYGQISGSLFSLFILRTHFQPKSCRRGLQAT